LQRAEVSEHTFVTGHVIAAVAKGRRIERWQPQAVDTEPLKVVQLFHEATQDASPVADGILERPDQHLVEDGSHEPFGVGRACGQCVLKDGHRCRRSRWYFSQRVLSRTVRRWAGSLAESSQT